MEKRKMWLVLAAFKRVVEFGGREFKLEDGAWYAPMFEDRAQAEELAGDKFDILAVEVHEDDGNC